MACAFAFPIPFSVINSSSVALLISNFPCALAFTSLTALSFDLLFQSTWLMLKAIYHRHKSGDNPKPNVKHIDAINADSVFIHFNHLLFVKITVYSTANSDY